MRELARERGAMTFDHPESIGEGHTRGVRTARKRKGKKKKKNHRNTLPLQILDHKIEMSNRKKEQTWNMGVRRRLLVKIRKQSRDPPDGIRRAKVRGKDRLGGELERKRERERD